MLLAFGCVIAMTAVRIGVIATAIYPGVPNELGDRMVVLIALRLSISLARG
jgi:hypothetical protein